MLGLSRRRLLPHVLRTVLLLAVLPLGVSACPPPAAQVKPAPKKPPAPETQWHAWGPEVFERAKSEGRIVLVDAGIEGCTACRVMHDKTYAHPEVRRRIAAHFVAVSVDADQQPDLGAAYEAWGWPATIFVSADGKQLRALRGRFDPEDLLAVMDEVVKDPTPRAGDAGGPGLDDLDLSARCTRLVERLDEVGDAYGWGGNVRAIGSAPVLYSLYRVRKHDERERKKRALAATEGFRSLIDPVWGGVFVAARNPDWTDIVYEKRLLHQAMALEAFAAAYRETNDADWLRAAKSVLRYLDSTLEADDGTFYATQEDAPVEPGLPIGMSTREYYNLDDEGRRLYGVPPIDHGVYTDQNARLVSSLVMLYGATDDKKVLDRALHAMAALEKRITEAGWAVQVTEGEKLAADQRMRPLAIDNRLYLAPQVYLGLAALALHQVTRDDKWLYIATAIGTATAALQDEDGGLFAGAARTTVGPRAKPFLDNIFAARFYTWLGAVTDDATHTERAERILRYAGRSGVLLMVGPDNIATYAHALDEFLNRDGGSLCGG